MSNQIILPFIQDRYVLDLYLITCFHEKTTLLMSFETSFLMIHLPEIVDRDSDLLSGVNRETDMVI